MGGGFLMRGYMPQRPNVAISLCIASNTKSDLSYFCIWARCPFLKRLARLSGQLENACVEHKGIALDSSNAELGYEAVLAAEMLNG